MFRNLQALEEKMIQVLDTIQDHKNAGDLIKSIEIVFRISSIKSKPNEIE